MKISDVIVRLETQGIELWQEENQLRFRAPAGVMTEAIMQELRDHKPAILDWLRQQERGRRCGPIPMRVLHLSP